jgi:hypothetical protein
MKDITLASCSYNTPMVTMTMLKSFFNYHDETNVLICENSTNDDTVVHLKNENVPFISNKGGLHAPSVDLLIQHCVTKYMLLVDTDIIFLKSHKDIFNQFKDMELTLMGEVCGDRGGKALYNRVHPWHCFIDIENIKNNNIKFFDSKRLSNNNFKKIYDVGASFFEDINKHQLKIGNVNLHNVYYKHYEGMSWRVNKFGNSDGNIDVDTAATHNNQNLFKYGKMIEENYMSNEIKIFKDVKICAK